MEGCSPQTQRGGPSTSDPLTPWLRAEGMFCFCNNTATASITYWLFATNCTLRALIYHLVSSPDSFLKLIFKDGGGRE